MYLKVNGLWLAGAVHDFPFLTVHADHRHVAWILNPRLLVGYVREAIEMSEIVANVILNMVEANRFWSINQIFCKKYQILIFTLYLLCTFRPALSTQIFLLILTRKDRKAVCSLFSNPRYFVRLRTRAAQFCRIFWTLFRFIKIITFWNITFLPSNLSIQTLK